MLRRPILRPVLFTAGLTAAWQAVALLNHLNEWYWTHVNHRASAPIAWRFLSSPVDVLRSLPEALGEGQLVAAGWATLWHAAVATVIASALGLRTGKLLAGSAVLRATTLPVIRALSGIPPVTLLPVFLLAFRLSAWSVIALAVFGAFFSATTICMDAFISVPSDLKTMLRKLGYSPWGTGLWAISTIWTQLTSAVREAARWALILVVVGEMHGSLAGGLGAYVDSARLNQLYANVYLGVIACGIASIVLVQGLTALGNWLHAWVKRVLLNRSGQGDTADSPAVAGMIGPLSP